MGAIAVRDPASGYCKEGVTEVGAIALGFFGWNENATPDGVYDNSAGIDAAIFAHIEPGTRKMMNSSGGDLIAVTNRFQDCFIVDNQTVALTDGGGNRSLAGKIIAIDDDGGVFVEVGLAHSDSSLATQGIQRGTGTMVAGVLSVSTGVKITANSVINFSRKTQGGTPGVAYDAPAADRTVGAPGTGAFKVRSYSSSNVVVTTDTSTIDWIIIG